MPAAYRRVSGVESTPAARGCRELRGQWRGGSPIMTPARDWRPEYAVLPPAALWAAWHCHSVLVLSC